MSKNTTTVTVLNISDEDQRVRITAGEGKETVEAGAEFVTDVQNAKDLARMYPNTFKIEGTFVEPVEGEQTATVKVDVAAAKMEVLQAVHTAAGSILDSVVPMIDDEAAEGLITAFNETLEAAIDEEHPAFSLTKDEERVLTDEDFKNNADALPKDAKVGDKVTIPVPAYERPAPVEAVEPVDTTELEEKITTLEQEKAQLEAQVEALETAAKTAAEAPNPNANADTPQTPPASNPGPTKKNDKK